MTALELVQEVAKRVGILLPLSINMSQVPDSSSNDYDANLIVSHLNATIAQIVVNFHRNQQIYEKRWKYITNQFSAQYPVKVYVNDENLGNNEFFYDFEVFLKNEADESRFLSLVGDGIIVECKTAESEKILRLRRYLFRQLSHQDFLRLYKDRKDQGIDSANALDAIDEPNNYEKNMPSQDYTNITLAENKESGFFIRQGTDNSILVNAKNEGSRSIYFCNNLIKWKEFRMLPLPAPHKIRSTEIVAMLNSPYIVFNDGTPKLRVTADDDIITYYPELLILGTIIGYKTYYGLDPSMELGQQKALQESLKVSEENVQLTRLDAKEYKNPYIKYKYKDNT